MEFPTCGLCFFFNEVRQRDEKTGEETSTGMGFCNANPPKVYLFPGPAPKVAMGAGNQTEMSLQPRNLRPAVGSEDLCCRFFIPREGEELTIGNSDDKCNRSEGDACSDCKS